MAVIIPTAAEARAVLEAAYPGLVITDNMVEGARYRIAVGLGPFPSENEAVEKLIKKVINHENRLDALETP